MRILLLPYRVGTQERLYKLIASEHDYTQEAFSAQLARLEEPPVQAASQVFRLLYFEGPNIACI